MTLLQLHYLTAVAENGSINKASKYLFVSQSSISVALRDLEDQIGITIFERNNQGVTFTKSGLDFYNNIRPILDLEKKVMDLYSYKGRKITHKLRISSQHYPFVTHAFTAFLQLVNDSIYDLSLIETNTNTIINDVAAGRSNLGIIYLSSINKCFLQKILINRDLIFHPLKKIHPHVYVRKEHPLALRKTIYINELNNYPYAMYNIDDACASVMNFAEEVLPAGFVPSPCIIKINDRCTMRSILTNTDAFSIGSGLLTTGFTSSNITTIPLGETIEEVRLGYIKQKAISFGQSEASFIGLLEECLKKSKSEPQ